MLMINNHETEETKEIERYEERIPGPQPSDCDLTEI